VIGIGIGIGLPDTADESLLSVVSIAITGTTSIQAGATTTLTATATYSNGTTADVTSTATWTTADATMATVSAGVVTGVKLTANVVITATLGAISGTATCSVYVSFAGVSAGAWTQVWGLTLTRASSATVRTGTSTITTSGITTNVARVGKRLDADTPGLLIECARTNLCKSSEDPTSADWLAGVTVVTTRPDGTPPDTTLNTATKHAVTAAGYSRYAQFSATTGVKHTYSQWHQSPSGSITARWQVGSATATYSCTTSWARVTGAYTTTGVIHYLTIAVTDAQTVRTWGHQVEVGEFESSYIQTGLAATATRAGERLVVTTNTTTSGRLKFAFDAAMLGSSSEYATDGATASFCYGDANNGLSWNASTRVLTVTANGSTNTCTLTAWSRYDVIGVSVSAGANSATVVKMRINGGAPSTLTITGSALGNFTAASLDLFCEGTSKQSSCRIQSIYLETPAWAA
jgi:hypothetical protein